MNGFSRSALVLLLSLAAPLWARAASPAIALDHPQQVPLVAAAQAGQRLVAVGDHGVVILSDDGKTWRQSQEVPVDGLLTALSFIDARQGWAVGQGGVLLHTTDGGEHWSLQQRFEGKPALLSVWFANASRGLVSGAYGYLARTLDGGQSWQRLELDGDDFHLNHLFAGQDGKLFIAA